MLAYNEGTVGIHTAIRVRIEKEVDGIMESRMVNATVGRLIFNEPIPQDLGFQKRNSAEKLFVLEIDFLVGKKQLGKIIDKCIRVHGFTIATEMLDNLKSLGYKFSTKGAITVSIADMSIPEKKYTLIEQSEQDVVKIDRQYKRGFITNDERYRLTVDEVAAMLVQTIASIRDINPKVRIIFTVSPIRHFKDGAHQNMLSKSTLLLAIDQVCQVVDRVDYFPAYEIVMDELRDYRFYAADMVHPSEVAIEYLWQRFREWCFSADANRATDEALRLRSRLNHRFLTADTAAQQAFRAQTDKLLAEFLSRHPYLRP
jgi:hypothetical protein